MPWESCSMSFFLDVLPFTLPKSKKSSKPFSTQNPNFPKLQLSLKRWNPWSKACLPKIQVTVSVLWKESKKSWPILGSKSKTVKQSNCPMPSYTKMADQENVNSKRQKKSSPFSNQTESSKRYFSLKTSWTALSMIRCRPKRRSLQEKKDTQQAPSPRAVQKESES